MHSNTLTSALFSLVLLTSCNTQNTSQLPQTASPAPVTQTGSDTTPMIENPSVPQKPPLTPTTSISPPPSSPQPSPSAKDTATPVQTKPVSQQKPPTNTPIEAPGCPSQTESPDLFKAQQVLLNEDLLAIKDPKFGDSPNDLNQWRHWGGDFYPSEEGIRLWNPQNGSTTEAGLIRTIALVDQNKQSQFQKGASIRTQITALPRFTSPTSQFKLALSFDDLEKTYVESALIKGTFVKKQILHIATEIPPCAQNVTLHFLSTLNNDETKSVNLTQASMYLTPANFYKTTFLLQNNFDNSVDNAFGKNSPSELEEEFGYDAYLTPLSSPKYAGDQAVTLHNPGTPDPNVFGGLIKTIEIGEYAADSKISASLFSATTFTDPTSQASFYIEFYNAEDKKLEQVNSPVMSGTHFYTLFIPETSIPLGSTKLKVIPVLKFGATEASSLQWDDLEVKLLEPQV